MLTAKVFKSGNSQAVRIPKEYQVDEAELFINRVGRTLVLFPKNDPWEQFKQNHHNISDDFFSRGRDQPEPQSCGGLEDIFE
jgi:antitoxin VapB